MAVTVEVDTANGGYMLTTNNDGVPIKGWLRARVDGGDSIGKSRPTAMTQSEAIREAAIMNAR